MHILIIYLFIALCGWLYYVVVAGGVMSNVSSHWLCMRGSCKVPVNREGGCAVKDINPLMNTVNDELLIDY